LEKVASAVSISHLFALIADVENQLPAEIDEPNPLLCFWWSTIDLLSTDQQ
jgi:hypothetical protein